MNGSGTLQGTVTYSAVSLLKQFPSQAFKLDTMVKIKQKGVGERRLLYLIVRVLRIYQVREGLRDN